MKEAQNLKTATEAKSTFDLAEVKQLEQGLISAIVVQRLEGDTEAPPDEKKARNPSVLRQELALKSDGDLRTVFGLARRFDLSPIERDALLLAFAPELDPRNRAAFVRCAKATSQEGRPTVWLLTHLLSENPEQQLQVRAALSRRGKLRRFRLLDVIERPGWPEADALVCPSPEIRELLLGYGLPLPGTPVRGIAEEAPDGVTTELSIEPDRGAPIFVVGESRADRRATAAAIAASQGFSVLIGTLSQEESRGREAEEVAARVRDALLHGAVAAVELDEVEARHQPSLLTRVLGADDMPKGSLFLLLQNDMSGALPELASRLETLQATPVDYSAIRGRWESALSKKDVSADDLIIDAAAGSFRLEPWAIDAVVERAAAEKNHIEKDALLRAARSLAGRTSVSHARRVVPRYQLDDMVLPDSVRAHLSLLIGFAAERERLLHSYGFAKRFTIGHGLVALLSGESGTGKTMAAEVLARNMGRELYIVDLSQLVSKWVGETEKHIDQVFTEAEQAHGVLLFDEADSLFSSRTNDVSSSNDRYANMEVGFLLQRIESFRGVAVLTTNLSQSIDDAFLRRFHFRIDIPRPTAELRAELWQRMLPSGAIEENGMDLDALSRRFDLTGGNIRNALMKATYLSDKEGTPISQRHLTEAAALESAELGRLV